MQRLVPIAALITGLLLTGCRGSTSEQPPIHPNLDMDFQEKFDPQERNAFFADNRSMRTPVPGTVARGFLREETRFYLGRTDGGAYVEEMPVSITRELLERGQERYNVYCSVCHGQAGDGQGIIMTGDYGYTPATNYHSDRIRNAPDGYIYDVISNGVRNMPSYGAQVAVADRWAIVAYVRALQRSQHAPREDVPPSVRAQIEQRAGASMDDTDTTGTIATDTTTAVP